jgi:hypothetical protein
MSLFYSGYPLLNDHLWSKVELFDSLEEAVRCDNSDSILILRYFRYEENLDHERDVQVDRLTPVREKYSNVIFFDDADGAGDTRFEVLPFVDKYLKKQIFGSFEDYQRRLYGRHLFTDYYHEEYGVEDEKRFTRLPLSPEVNASKIVLAWNLGAGAYPIHPFHQKIGVALARLFGKKGIYWRYSTPAIRSKQSTAQKSTFVHAHFGAKKGRPTVDFQRELFFGLIEGEEEFRCGQVSKKEYDENMSKAMITLSPFGWGEVCFRDFEAIQHGSTLMKPDMSHLETWPDIYEPYETYIPVSWDGDDIVPKAREYLSKPRECARMAENAWSAWMDSLAGIEERVDSMLGL